MCRKWSEFSLHVLRNAILKSKCQLTTKTSFKMQFMTYSSIKELLAWIQKTHAPNIIMPCYRTLNSYYTRYVQHTLYLLPGKNCIDCFLPSLPVNTGLEGMLMVFILFFWTSTLFPSANVRILSTNDSKSDNVLRCNFCQLDILNFGTEFSNKS